MRTTQSFENLDFSFWIDTENRTAYVQHWDGGGWSEADRYMLPQALDTLPKKSKLARAVKSFRGDHSYGELCRSLEAGLVRDTAPASLRSRLLQWAGVFAPRVVRTDP